MAFICSTNDFHCQQMTLTYSKYDFNIQQMTFTFNKKFIYTAI